MPDYEKLYYALFSDLSRIIDILEIVRQNYGFDLGSGITRVSIDPAQQHCYLEVRRAQRGD